MCEDRMAARGRRAARYLDKASRDLAHRATGLAHEAAHLARGETPREDGHRPMSFDLMNEHLAPGTRLVLGALGGGLIHVRADPTSPEACVLGTIGAALALPATTGGGAASGFGLRLAASRRGGARRSAVTAEQPRRPVPVM